MLCKTIHSATRGRQQPGGQCQHPKVSPEQAMATHQANNTEHHGAVKAHGLAFRTAMISGQYITINEISAVHKHQGDATDKRNMHKMLVCTRHVCKGIPSQESP